MKCDPAQTPSAELSIDSHLVRRLLSQQHPELADLPLRAVEEGWDNALFRLGDNLAVRLPRRAAGAPLICHEQQWLPVLGQRLPLPVPTPLRLGSPSREYPWNWSVVPWFAGEACDRIEMTPNQAQAFGGFLRSLHGLERPSEAPENPWRGVPLKNRAEAIEARIERLSAKTHFITPEVRRLWGLALNAPYAERATWLHGDLHPRNVLAKDGMITGVIDWGDLCAGDPATDLASAWMLFPDQKSREHLWDAYGVVSAADLQRSQGWALHFALVLLETGLNDNPYNADIGKIILKRLTKTR